ncbi:MAG: 4-alpha-glucanotransferase [Dehalococcoidia bacterium]|nr:MAG: 4-alpha-glucanotransferase [Dehalococcoidia bacterium]
MTTNRVASALHKLAKAYGVQTAYYDMEHKRQPASTEALLSILSSLGAHVSCLQDVPSALREHEQDQWRRPLEPVNVAWNGVPAQICIRLAPDEADCMLTGHLISESGDYQDLKYRCEELPIIELREVEGIKYTVRLLTLPSTLSYGYHYLILDIPGRSVKTMLISAPQRLYSYDSSNSAKFWGIFLPLYSLHSEKSWGAGDLSDLERLIKWIGGLGGGVVATLPLLPTFLDKPFDHSPYAPVSRLAWSEFYVDVDRALNQEHCMEAEGIISSPSFQSELDRLRNTPLIDYKAQMKLKRVVLDKLSQHFYQNNSLDRENLQSFIGKKPEIEDYAQFRATCETRDATWPSWPQALRDGTLSNRDYDEEIRRYYIYTQWLLHKQLTSLVKESSKHGPGLYLDYALGVHPDGYDAWRYRNLFVNDVSAGAPPDPVFTSGQDWGFPPLHPERLREDSHGYFISCIRNHLLYAGILRIDHVMGLHRLFVIPNGMEPSKGVYLRYKHDEFYAILSVESHRNPAIIIGEDLGTVPPDVRPAMNRHGLYRNYVVQYELCTDCNRPLPPIPHSVSASINTHDMPPLAAFWQGLDIGDRLELQLLERTDEQNEKRSRDRIRRNLTHFLRSKRWSKLREKATGELSDILKATLYYLCASPAIVVLVNLEDLWLETEPQNIPGTQDRRPNWCRKAKYSFETFSELPEVTEVLQEIDTIRNIRKKGAVYEAGKK